MKAIYPGLLAAAALAVASTATVADGSKTAIEMAPAQTTIAAKVSGKSSQAVQLTDAEMDKITAGFMSFFTPGTGSYTPGGGVHEGKGNASVFITRLNNRVCISINIIPYACSP